MPLWISFTTFAGVSAGHNASMMSVMPTGLFALAASSPTRVGSRSDKPAISVASVESSAHTVAYVRADTRVQSPPSLRLREGLVNGPSLHTEEDEDATQAVPVRGNSRPALPLPANHYRGSATNITDAD
jgi:hypothetical protein